MTELSWGAEYQNFLAINIIQEHLLSYLADSRISSQSTIGMPAYPGTLGDDDLYHFSLCSCPNPSPSPSPRPNPCPPVSGFSTYPTLTVQIGSAEQLLASFLFVLSFYEESLGGRGYVTVLSTDTLQAPLDHRIELVESYLLILEH